MEINHKTDIILHDILPEDCYNYCVEGLPELFKCEPHEVYQFVEWYPSINEVKNEFEGLITGNLEDYVSLYEDTSFKGVLVIF